MVTRLAKILSLARLRDLRSDSPLRQRALKASFWSVGTHLTSQVIRLTSNLILTRLLFPEAFGIMVIIQTITLGVTLLTDLGVEISIVQNKKGQESEFLNSAWTVNVIQGIFIWAALCLLAPYISSFYGQPMLRDLLQVAGFSAVLAGMASVNFSLAIRNLDLRNRVLIEVGSNALGVVVMILLAWASRSVWALVWGGLVGSGARTILSHLFLAGPKSRLFFDLESVKEILKFGKWALVSSALTFFVSEGNKLLLGKLLGVEELALYSMASVMSLVFLQVAQQLIGRVYFPAYTEILRERPERLRVVLLRCRLSIMIPGWLIAFFFTHWGDQLMWFLYDERYSHSGYILEILGMGMLVGIIGFSYSGLLFAKGLVRTYTIMLGVESAAQISAVIFGYYLMGGQGAILGIAFASWLLYPVQAFVYARLNLWEAKVDLLFFMLSILVVYSNIEKLVSYS